MVNSELKYNNAIYTRRKLSLSDLCLFILLLFIFCVPRRFATIKLCLFVLYVLLNFKKLFKPTSVNWVKIFFPYYMYAFIGAVGGLIRFNSDTLSILSVAILWFSFFTVILKIISTKELTVIYNSCFISFVFITFYNLFLVLFPNNYILQAIDATAAVGFHDTYIHITTTNSSMYIVLYPLFLITLIMFTPKDYKKVAFNRMSLFFVVILSSIAIILTGRRILWIIMLFTLIISAFIKFSLKKILFVAPFLIICLFIVGYYTSIISNLWNRFIEAISVQGGSSIRYESITYLWNDFLLKPIFGYGFGVYFYLPSRGWINAVEVSYSQLLFNVGLFGSIFYFLFFFFLYRKMIKLKPTTSLEKTIKISVILMLSLALLANATNPYIGSSFDFYIFIFLPVFLLKIVENKNVVENKNIKKKSIKVGNSHERYNTRRGVGNKIVPTHKSNK